MKFSLDSSKGVETTKYTNEEKHMPAEQESIMNMCCLSELFCCFISMAPWAPTISVMLDMREVLMVLHVFMLRHAWFPLFPIGGSQFPML
jgi:hypothetical protein